MSERIGIVVDGYGDFASLRKRFREGYKILKTDGPRGDKAAVREIALKSRKQIGMLQAYQCSRVIILLDLEQRNENYDEFTQLIRNCFDEMFFKVPVSIAVANRMIENWYLADIEHLSKNKAFLRKRLKQKNFEGKNGKHIIKRFMKNGFSYSETDHGPQLFEIIRFEVARQNSRSFADFLHIAGDNYLI